MEIKMICFYENSMPQYTYWTAHIRSQAEAWKAEALIGFSVFKTSVCVSVCSQATGHSFWPRNLIFWHNTPWDMRKKRNFLFFEILIFGPLRALFRPFSSIFFFILCKSSVRATSHTDRLTNLIFGTESLYDTIPAGMVLSVLYRETDIGYLYPPNIG